jgi:hypothetical protein
MRRYDLCMGTGPKREQRDALRERLADFARDAERFPGGPHESGSCTGCAYLVVEHFGGQVRGYFHAHNEGARVGETEGGHDFAITSERFLVDAWIFHYYGEEPVLDLNIDGDLTEALARYGPEENWQRLRDAPVLSGREAGREHPARVLKAG